jgi:AcrR family transcriptional regulator
MAVARTPRHRWIEEGLHLLSTGGPAAVRVETLAEALGVTKGGFYGYFANRDALLVEMLDTWEHAITEAVIEEVDSGGGDGRSRLDRLFTVVASIPEGTLRSTAMELAVRDWARRDEAVAQRLRRVDNVRMAYLRSLYGTFCSDPADVEARCMITYSVRIGTDLIAAEHPGRSRAEVMGLIKTWLQR